MKRGVRFCSTTSKKIRSDGSVTGPRIQGFVVVAEESLKWLRIILPSHDPLLAIMMKTRTALRKVNNTVVAVVVVATLPQAEAGIDGDVSPSTRHGIRAESSDSMFSTA